MMGQLVATSAGTFGGELHAHHCAVAAAATMAEYSEAMAYRGSITAAIQPWAWLCCAGTMKGTLGLHKCHGESCLQDVTLPDPAARH